MAFACTDEIIRVWAMTKYKLLTNILRTSIFSLTLFLKVIWHLFLKTSRFKTVIYYWYSLLLASETVYYGSHTNLVLKMLFYVRQKGLLVCFCFCIQLFSFKGALVFQVSVLLALLPRDHPYTCGRGGNWFQPKSTTHWLKQAHCNNEVIMHTRENWSLIPLWGAFVLMDCP